MIKYLCPLLLLFLLTNCKDIKKDTSTYLIKDSAPIPYENKNLSDIVDYFDLVPLETSDSSLILITKI